MIAHIAEISRRDLHLQLGYQNLFEYVSDRLGFQGGSAGLRIHVAKKARDCPRLLEALWSGDLCLSGAALLVPHLSAENVDRMVRASAGKSTREIEEMLRSVAPLPVYEPGIRKQPERARTEESAPAPATTAPAEAVPAVAEKIALPGVLEPPAQKSPTVPHRTSNVR